MVSRGPRVGGGNRNYTSQLDHERVTALVLGRRRRPAGLPVRTLTTLYGGGANAATEHRFLGLDRVRAILDRLGMLAGVHANRIAGAGLHAEAADHAPELVDLEDRRALLD